MRLPLNAFHIEDISAEYIQRLECPSVKLKKIIEFLVEKSLPENPDCGKKYMEKKKKELIIIF